MGTRLRHLLGIPAPFLRYRRILLGRRVGSVKIIIYHAVPDSDLEKLRKQIIWLSKRYAFIDPDTFHAFMEGRIGLQGRHLMITFDDGFASARKAAEAVLKPMEIKALFFLPSGFIELENHASWRSYVADQLFAGTIAVEEVGDSQKPMTWEDVLWLQSQGHTIGAHTRDHCRLSMFDDVAQMEKQICAEQEHLEQVLGQRVIDMAFPFGTIDSINNRCIALIGKHYRFCYSGVRGVNDVNTPSLSIRREAVCLDDPPSYVGFLMENGLGGLYCTKRRRLDNMAAVCGED